MSHACLPLDIRQDAVTYLVSGAGEYHTTAYRCVINGPDQKPPIFLLLVVAVMIVRSSAGTLPSASKAIIFSNTTFTVLVKMLVKILFNQSRSLRCCFKSRSSTYQQGLISGDIHSTCEDGILLSFIAAISLHV